MATIIITIVSVVLFLFGWKFMIGGVYLAAIVFGLSGSWKEAILPAIISLVAGMMLVYSAFVIFPFTLTVSGG